MNKPSLSSLDKKNVSSPEKELEKTPCH